MKYTNGQILGGAFLVGGGLLLLLQNLGFLGGGELLWAALFALVGLAFFAVYFRDRRWWALIPGCALLGLAAPTALSVAGDRWAEFGGAVFLAMLGAAFATVYLDNRPVRWWALIPAGTLLTLAVVASLDLVDAAEAGGGVFFLGLALTFFAVALLPHGDKRRDWALYPAIACLGLGAIVVAASTSTFTIVAAVGLIGTGLYLLYRTGRFAHR
jgi:hypothetical protein